MRLHHLLHISPGDTVALVGAGGKTTALWRLAAERRAGGALVTTSTHILRPGPEVCERFLSPKGLDALRAACAPGRVVCAAYPAADGKCTGLPPALFAAARRAGLAILYEADGAARRPAKLHRAGEPAVHPDTDTVLLLAGLRALGRPVGQACHRFSLSPRMARDASRPFDADDLLETILDGVRACAAPPERIRILLNQADAPCCAAGAEPVQQALRAQGYFVHTGCLRDPFWP